MDGIISWFRMKEEGWTEGKAEVRFVGEVVNIDGKKATLRLYPQYCEGLRDISAYSHLIVLYWAHLRDNEEERRAVLVLPRRHGRKVETGVFACRSPTRPNPICLYVVELLGVEDCDLRVKGLDAEQGTPIVDIKPYHPHSDSVQNAKFPEWVLKYADR